MRSASVSDGRGGRAPPESHVRARRAESDIDALARIDARTAPRTRRSRPSSSRLPLPRPRGDPRRDARRTSTSPSFGNLRRRARRPRSSATAVVCPLEMSSMHASLALPPRRRLPRLRRRHSPGACAGTVAGLAARRGGRSRGRASAGYEPIVTDWRMTNLLVVTLLAAARLPADVLSALPRDAVARRLACGGRSDRRPRASPSWRSTSTSRAPSGERTDRRASTPRRSCRGARRPPRATSGSSPPEQRRPPRARHRRPHPAPTPNRARGRRAAYAGADGRPRPRSPNPARAWLREADRHQGRPARPRRRPGHARRCPNGVCTRPSLR